MGEGQAVNLPKRYSLTVEVRLQELANQFQEEEQPISDDPMKAAMTMFSKAIPAMGSSPFQQPAGFDFRKGTTVTVQTFQGLAKIIEQYDELTKQIEAERP
jgi:hypothetical protein